MKHPIIIPGYVGDGISPSPASKLAIMTFQANNGCEVDGRVGPETHGACWPGAGAKPVRLCPYVFDWSPPTARFPYDGASPYIAWVLAWGSKTPLGPANLVLLAEILSSNWSTGFSYLDGRDGITLGFRRYAGSGLRSLVRANESLIKMLGLWSALKNWERQQNNTGPISDPSLRSLLLTLAQSRSFCNAQWADFDDDLFNMLALNPGLVTGRTIAYAFRARNSATVFVRDLPVNDSEARAEIKARYIASRGDRAAERLAEIDGVITPDERWR